MAVYGEDVIQQDLAADEMLLHFSSLSMHMSGHVVLRKVIHVICVREIAHDNKNKFKLKTWLINFVWWTW